VLKRMDRDASSGELTVLGEVLTCALPTNSRRWERQPWDVHHPLNNLLLNLNHKHGPFHGAKRTCLGLRLSGSMSQGGRMFEIQNTNGVRCMEATYPTTAKNPHGQCERWATVWIRGGVFHGLRLCDRCIQFYCTNDAEVLPISTRLED
jgi:hypothetical protein